MREKIALWKKRERATRELLWFLFLFAKQEKVIWTKYSETSVLTEVTRKNSFCRKLKASADKVPCELWKFKTPSEIVPSRFNEMTIEIFTRNFSIFIWIQFTGKTSQNRIFYSCVNYRCVFVYQLFFSFFRTKNFFAKNHMWRNFEFVNTGGFDAYKSW